VERRKDFLEVKQAKTQDLDRRLNEIAKDDLKSKTL